LTLTELAAKLIAARVVGCSRAVWNSAREAWEAVVFLGDPRNPDIQTVMNVKVKFREEFRPFAPAVLKEEASRYFDISEIDSPYMLLVTPVREERRMPLSEKDAQAAGDFQAENYALGNTCGHPCRLFRTRANGRPGPAWDLSETSRILLP